MSAEFLHYAFVSFAGVAWDEVQVDAGYAAADYADAMRIVPTLIRDGMADAEQVLLNKARNLVRNHHDAIERTAAGVCALLKRSNVARRPRLYKLVRELTPMSPRFERL